MASMDFTIIKFAFCSRCLVICLQFLSNCLIPDHNADVFNSPLTSSERFTLGNRLVHFILGGFQRWDAIYFLHIAQHGYTYENCAAFFPLYPWIISPVKVVSLVCPYISESSLILLFAVSLNLALFVVTAVLLLHLGQVVTQDRQLSYQAAILFCVNPASIFMTAPYSETLFACLSFGGMLCIKQKKFWTGAVLFGASGLTRSNGLVSTGFILHYFAVKYISWLPSAYKVNSLQELICETVKQGLRAVLFTFISLIPFVLYQFYIYELFCFPENSAEINLPSENTLINYGRAKGYKLVGEGPASPWCFSSLPFSYSFIQSYYWDVGFLTYYQMKQIPNFMLAAPIITLSFCTCYSFYQEHPRACRALGLIQTNKCEVETVGSYAAEKERTGWNSVELVVYIVHLFFLTVFGCLFMHIQVLTRFLCSSSPMIYWFAAYLVFDHCRSMSSPLPYSFDSSKDIFSTFFMLYKDGTTLARCVLIFFLGYFVIGTVAFSNFLPWT